MDQTFSKFQPIALSLFRFITGLLLFQYGIAKIFKFPVLPYFANIPPLITAAGTIELVLGALLMIGLWSRIVAFILSGEMACAYFLGHMFKNPAEPVWLPLNNGGTAAILFCFACLYLSTAGGGPYSVDAKMGKKN
jgi:putative oxidoreductase